MQKIKYVLAVVVLISLSFSAMISADSKELSILQRLKILEDENKLLKEKLDKILGTLKELNKKTEIQSDFIYEIDTESIRKKLVKKGYKLGKQRQYKGHYYAAILEAKTWADAKKVCENLGGHLVTISCQEENNFVTDLMVKSTKLACWIGYTDEVKEENWRWVDRTGSSFKNWYSGEPNGKALENYCHLINPGGSWDDAGKRINLHFICEWDK